MAEPFVNVKFYFIIFKVSCWNLGSAVESWSQLLNLGVSSCGTWGQLLNLGAEKSWARVRVEKEQAAVCGSSVFLKCFFFTPRGPEIARATCRRAKTTTKNTCLLPRTSTVKTQKNWPKNAEPPAPNPVGGGRRRRLSWPRRRRRRVRPSPARRGPQGGRPCSRPGWGSSLWNF